MRTYKSCGFRRWIQVIHKIHPYFCLHMIKSDFDLRRKVCFSQLVFRSMSFALQRDILPFEILISR